MAEVRDNPALGAYFRPEQPEPFVVVEVGATQGLSREAVVLSVGFGRTPHGRVLHRFGALSEAGGEGRLLEALGSTRRRLTLVSCFSPTDLDPDRLRAPGARLLAALLRLADERTRTGPAVGRPVPSPQGDPDRLVLDLAERLWRLGLTVDLDHGIPGGPRIPLVVGHPDLPDEMMVAVLTDDDAYVAEPSVRVRDRQVPERLERLGWTVVQVWSAAAFLDPQGEADAICAATVDACAQRLASRPKPRPKLTVPELRPEPSEVAEPSDPSVPEAISVPDATVEPSASGEAPADQSVPADVPVAAETAADPVVLDDGGPTGSASPADALDPAEPQESPAAAESLDPAAPAAPALAPGRTKAHPAWHPVAHDAAMEPLFEVPPHRGRAPVEPGLPIGAYSDDQLDDLVVWIKADGVPRTDPELAAAIRAELGIVRRGSRVNAAVNGAVRRAR